MKKMLGIVFLISLYNNLSPVSAREGLYNVTRNITFLFSFQAIVDDSQDAANPTLRVQMRLYDYDATWWTTTNGSEGFFFYFGLGEMDLNNTDLIMCQYRHRNLSTDNFICYDTYSLYPAIDGPPSVGQLKYTMDRVQNVLNFKTIDKTLRTSGKYLRGDFIAEFQRKFTTNDSTDY